MPQDTTQSDKQPQPLEDAFREGSQIWIRQIDPLLGQVRSASSEQLSQFYAGLILAGFSGMAADLGPAVAQQLSSALAKSFATTCANAAPGHVH